MSILDKKTMYKICKTAFQIKVNLRLKSKWNKNGDFSL
nr:MAG TPA: hypothetical protein [Caudoviricetes sp.]